jgi:hypothetical protein
MFRSRRRFTDPDAPAPAPVPVRAPVTSTWEEDANTSSDAGSTTTETDPGVITDSVLGAAGVKPDAGVRPGPNGGWTMFGNTPIGGVEVSQEGGTTTTETTLGNDKVFEVHAGTAVGREEVNDRYNSDSNNLAYTLTGMLGVDEIDIVGMKDKLSLSNGWSTSTEPDDG